MKTMTVGEFKSHFSDVMEEVKEGGEIAVTYGKKKEVIGYFVPTLNHQSDTRSLGLLDGKAEVIFKDDFKMTEEEFLSL